MLVDRLPLPVRSLLSLLVLLPCVPLAAQSREPASLRVTYAHHALSVALPYHADRGGEAQLSVQLLSPEDEVLGESVREIGVQPGDQEWKAVIALPEQTRLDELVWERVLCRVTYVGESKPVLETTRSVSEVLERPLLHVMGQGSYLAYAPASLRVVVADQEGRAIAGAGTVRVELNDAGAAPRVLFAGTLDKRGSLEPQWKFPRDVAGHHVLRIVADTVLGEVETSREIRVEDKASILLTTEKPIYQPGQTIHVRALALARGNHHAVEQKLTFEVEDSRGNKVFRKSTATDAFGVASAEFTLADEVNLGAYHLHALMGDREAASDPAELTLQVERYVLPKFRVAIDLAQKDGKPKRDYRPGDHITGTVHANYFFGKPVDRSEIEIKASGMDVAEFAAAHESGKTDSEGNYRFDLKLPGYFAGDKLNKGAAPVLVEATVKDATGHAEMHGEPVTVSASALLITAVPEGGKLVPGLENQVYLLTSYADGTPAATHATVQVNEGRAEKIVTDANGIGTLRMTPTSDTANLRVEADDQRGSSAADTIQLETRSGDDQVLLRSDRGVYKAGDRIELHVLSTRQQGAAYIDVVKDGQTILTRDVDLVHGRAQLSLNATPELAGTVQLNAYVFGSDSQAIADHRLIFVQPATELHVEASTDGAVYKPGEEAQVHLHVTDSHGAGVSAAVGTDVVDEAVFALAEQQPGFAKVFFYLERELLKPRYEIHSLSMNDVVSTGGRDEDREDLPAVVLFSAAEGGAANSMDEVAGRELPRSEMYAFQARYREAFADSARELADRLSREPEAKDRDINARFAQLRDAHGEAPRDAWGTPLRLEATGWNTHPQQYYRLISAGPDRKFDTSDDMGVTIETHSGTVFAQHGGSNTIHMLHDRGPVNGLAKVTGTVSDATGASIPGAKVRLLQLEGGAVRRATTGPVGDFDFSALPTGRYDLRIEALGFVTNTQTLTLERRDEAEVSSTLTAGEEMETVTVNAAQVEDMATEGRVVNSVAFAALPAPMSQVAGAGFAKKASAFSLRGAIGGVEDAKDDGGETTHVRSYFPEALYVNPEVITDGNGSANLSIPLADSITTWRMAMFASTKDGALGSGASSMKVFQDFFVDLDLPVTLTQGDRVSIPVAIYNYAKQRGDVTLKLQPDDWFSLVDDDAEKTVSVEPSRVGASQFTIEARRIGKFKLTLSASMSGGSERKDVVVREIEVVPNGEGKDVVFNGRLDGPVEQVVAFPQSAIPDASKILVRLYPGPMSQIVEGMDGVLRMPGGCFEQTSSSTYPNVLALDYMKRTQKLTPEIHAKAEGYIATGYQRLLTFEVRGGGFSWFGEAPANKILTAYGLMEFHDMASVYDVDPRVIERTANWLAAQQQPDGSWKPDTQFINEGATNRFNTDRLRITAYIAWALENTEFKGEAVAKAQHYLESHLSGATDAYTLAVLANLAVEGADSDFTQRVMRQLMEARQEKGDMVWWSSDSTGVYGSGESAQVETTGLAAQALLKSGESPEIARKALAWIVSKKGADGNWGTTQATIMALRALVMASEHGAADAHGTVQVTLNGKTVQSIALTAENNDLLQQIVLPGAEESSSNRVELRFDGTGGLAYQIAGRYFVPWTQTAAAEPLSIDVAYDRTKLAENDVVHATATVRSHLDKTANMVMVDLGIPPGFELQSEDLQNFEDQTARLKTGKLEKFSLTATQAILYFNAISAQDTVTLHYRLRAKYPIRAKNFESKVYEYYDPAVKANAKPVQFEVRAR